MTMKWALLIQTQQDENPRRFSYNTESDALRLRDRIRAEGGMATEPALVPTKVLLAQMRAA